MANNEWDCPQWITSRFETLYLNATYADGRRYQVKPEDFKVVPSIRVTEDNLSQQDGSQVHPRFKTGIVVTMTVRLQQQIGGLDGDYQPACDEMLVDMGEQIARVLNSIRDLTYADDQRYIWSPSGKANRMLQDIVLLAWPEPVFGGDTDPEPMVTFSFESPFPYAVDEAETTTVCAEGVAEAIDNNGSANIWPVCKVHGPFTAFTIVNSDGFMLEYDGTRPGAQSVASGHYAEIDFFRGTIFLDGDSTDLIPGIDPLTTDFFTLLGSPYASETIEVTGGSGGITMDVLWAPGYS